MRCPKCHEPAEPGFEQCWKCGADILPAAAQVPGDDDHEPAPEGERPLEPVLTFRSFRGILASWDALFSEAAAFATSVGRRNVVSISHSEDEQDGVVTVWYWTDPNGE